MRLFEDEQRGKKLRSIYGALIGFFLICLVSGITAWDLTWWLKMGQWEPDDAATRRFWTIVLLISPTIIGGTLGYATKGRDM